MPAAEIRPVSITDRPQQRQRGLFEFGKPLPWPQRRPHRGQHRDIEPGHRGLGRHLHDQHRDLLPVRVGDLWVGPPELLDDHRLAVVRRPDQQHVRHPLPARPAVQLLQPLQRRRRPGVADPPVRAHEPEPFLSRKAGYRPDLRAQVLQVRIALDSATRAASHCRPTPFVTTVRSRRMAPPASSRRRRVDAPV